MAKYELELEPDPKIWTKVEPEPKINNFSSTRLKKVSFMMMFFMKRLDILVNNAGILEMGSIENTSLEQVSGGVVPV